MGRLHDIRVKSEVFVANMNVHIANSIKQTEQQLIELNRKQMLSSVDSENKPLIHARTGSPNLSLAYAKRKGKSKPNLFDTGQFQGEMLLEVNENNSSWFIDSYNRISKFIVENYGSKTFGIFNTQRAKELTGVVFKRLYNSLVLGK